MPDVDRRPVRGRVRTRGWERLSHGLYQRPADGDQEDRELQLDELRAWTLTLPERSAFTHLTAARLHRWWLPAEIEHPVFVAQGTGLARARRQGLFVCRHPQPFAIRRVEGLWVTTAAETVLAAARDLGLLDVVVLADSALRQRDCTLGDLKRVASQRRRGAPLLRQAIPLLDARSESPWESVLRTLHLWTGTPVRSQHEIYDGSGRFLARADLWIAGTSVIHEYDGAGHREAEQHRADLARDRSLAAAHWTRMGWTASEVCRGAAEIIASADAALGRRWDPVRLVRWNELIDRSLLGAAGRRRARYQWRRTTQPSRRRRAVEVVPNDVPDPS